MSLKGLALGRTAAFRQSLFGRPSVYRKLLQITLLLGVAWCVPSGNVLADKCLYISSYHQGYAWSDGVERGLRSVLQGKCEIKQFDMDTKRNKGEEYKKRVALEAKGLIESWQPDVVITSDDNAAKYLIKPYYRGHGLPFVFSGINWTVDAYEFPYSNVTGIVEVAPVKAMFDRVTDLQGIPERGFYLGADTLTERKNLDRFRKVASRQGVELDYHLASTLQDWIAGYRRAQDYDFVIVGSNSGINDWQDDVARNAVLASSHKISLTNHAWMMPYTLLGLTKVPEEQGEWAAQAALHILDGTKPSDIAIVSNRKWDIWLNESVRNSIGIDIPNKIRRKAKKIDS